jgi:hypothetical protein
MAYNNYEGFPHLDFIFSQRLILNLQGLFHDEIDRRICDPASNSM